MRIDKFLKNARIIKRRSVAKDACMAERILVNDKIAKPGTEVQVGDRVKILFGNNTLEILIKEIIDSQRKEDAEKMYSAIES